MNDYLLIFLSEYLPDINKLYNKIEEYKSILKLMLHERFSFGDEGEEIDPIKSIAEKILWMEAYSQYISIILNIYIKISVYEENLFIKVDKLIKDKEIILEEDEIRNPHHTVELKFPFYYIIEALLRISIDINLLIKLKDKEEQKFYDFINLLKTITKDSLVINDELSIYSKEIFTIQEFLEIEEGLNNVNKSNIDNIIDVLKILLDISKINNQKDDANKQGENLSNKIKQLVEDFLLINLGDTEKYRELVMSIFVRESKKIKNDKYRHTLIEIILKNKNLIIYSYPFMSIIMEGFLSSDPGLIGGNLKNFQEDQTTWLELINKENNEILNQILLNIFEKKINIYFESIPNLNKEDLEEFFKNYFEKKNQDKINETHILLDKSLDLFK